MKNRKPKKIAKRASQKLFNTTARSIHPYNTVTAPVRGGIRL